MQSKTEKSPQSDLDNAIKSVIDSFQSQGLKPRRIASGRVEELRGGVTSIAFESHGNIDAAILLSKIQYQASESLYKLDYVVRGSIKGILPGRILAVTNPQLKGVIKKNGARG